MHIPTPFYAISYNTIKCDCKSTSHCHLFIFCQLKYYHNCHLKEFQFFLNQLASLHALFWQIKVLCNSYVISMWNNIIRSKLPSILKIKINKNKISIQVFLYNKSIDNSVKFFFVFSLGISMLNTLVWLKFLLPSLFDFFQLKNTYL